LFSTFDNSAVSRVDFLAGGFPATYGGRLSSVLDVQLKPGNDTESEVHGSVSALSSKLLVEGPLAPSVSYMIGARRTYVDQLLAPFDQDLLPYYFADGLGKITAVLPTKGTLSLTAYWGRDVLDMSWVDDEEGREGIDLEVDWGNRLAGLVYRQPLGSMELVQHFSVSKFSTGIGLEPDIQRLDNSAQVLTARTTLAMSINGAPSSNSSSVRESA